MVLPIIIVIIITSNSCFIKSLLYNDLFCGERIFGLKKKSKIFYFQPSEDTLIQIEDGSTHIICGGNEELRIKIRDTLLQCLAKL